MENKTVTSHITKGIAIALILIVIDLVALFTDLKTQSWYGWINLGLMLIAFIWACISFANQMNNAVTFGNVFVHGFKTSAVVACFLFIYSLLFVYVIAPEFVTNMIDKQWDEAERTGKLPSSMSSDDVEHAKEIGKKFGKMFVLAGSLLGPIIVGAIGSLLGAAFAKKNPPSPFSNNP
ncbi:MAG TPA: DUF4199 domain-containing protein [Chitinophagaceae bacterium]|nr:DUF4199 domain-containing protein [Chitinophagaceae bacterium]